MTAWSILGCRTGDRLIVISPFRDFDGVTWPIGTEWTYLGHDFSPHDDGYTLRFEQGDIRLSATVPEHDAILRHSETVFALR